MAKLHPKSKDRFSERLVLTLLERTERSEQDPKKPETDWKPGIDRYLESLGFVAGDEVFVKADYLTKTLIIGPHRD